MMSAADSTDNRIRLPELLSPAGSPSAMMAAVNAGADAVYFGMPEFNARIGADNFTRENLAENLRICHLLGVKAYITLNTQIYDREKEAFLETARFAYEAGVDAAIVGDLGAAALLRRYLPELPIHASTQLSGHNAMSGAELSKLGFSRMVCAREMSLADIKEFTKNSPIEAEIFIHGALCVCHSGQCLFSSLVGGRSGNRGLCAQPCRLPYKIGKRYEGLSGGGDAGKSGYHLSLKDSCLAMHVPEIIESGAASLKIEGRMKAADYVGRVTEVYRKLLDERRRATREEMEYLEAVFSRGGFTDRYFVGALSGDMLGIRSEADKERSRRLGAEGCAYLNERKRNVYMCAEIHKDKPMALTLSLSDDGSITVTVEGDVPLVAQNRPTDRAMAEKNLLKLGSTRFVCDRIDVNIDEGLMVPVSSLNSLRRGAAEALESMILAPYEGRRAEARDEKKDKKSSEPEKGSKREKIAIFTELAQIPDSAYGYFDKIYLPAPEFLRHGADGLRRINGVELPAVIFDSEKDEVRRMLAAAKEAGVRYALVGNLGHIALAREFGFELHGGSRLNVSNPFSAETVASFGFEDVILLPELTLPKCRDIVRAGKIDCLAVVYGKIPLMVVEKCVICEGLQRKGRELCPLIKSGVDKLCRGSLTDRTGTTFPVIRELSHRNVIYNAVPVYMADKQSELAPIAMGRAFIFSDETQSEAARVIKAYEVAAPAEGRIRRMGVQ